MGTGDADGEEGVDGETGVSFIAVPGEGRIGAEATTGEAGMAGAGTAGAGTAGAEESGSRLSRFIIRAITVIRVITAVTVIRVTTAGATAGAIIIRVTVTERR
jgi:hypothetical protein